MQLHLEPSSWPNPPDGSERAAILYRARCKIALMTRNRVAGGSDHLQGAVLIEDPFTLDSCEGFQLETVPMIRYVVQSP